MSATPEQRKFKGYGHGNRVLVHVTLTPRQADALLASVDSDLTRDHVALGTAIDLLAAAIKAPVTHQKFNPKTPRRT